LTRIHVLARTLFVVPALGLAGACTAVYDLDALSSADPSPVQVAEGGVDEVTSGGPPAGWAGPIALYEGSDEPPPSCVDTVVDGASVHAPDVVCGACTCASPSGRKCPSSFTINTNGKPSCAGNTCGTFTLSSSCAEIPSSLGPCSSAESFEPLPVGGPSGGSCAPVGPDVQRALPTATKVRLCTAPSASDKRCVSQDGDVACPGGAWTVKRVFFRNMRDDRACTPCACGAPTGGECTPKVTGHANTGCGSPVSSVDASSCRTFAFPAHLTGTVVLSPAGTCAPRPGGGQPTGNVVPVDPITVCCEG